MVCLCFGKLSHGLGIQMTTDGSGIYYKQLWTLTDKSQITVDAGVHFDNSRLQIGMFGYENHNQNIMLDVITGYRHELFSNQLAGHFRPIFIVGIGGMTDIAGIWMIKYMLGFGAQFYNRGILNEVTLKLTHTEAIEGNVAFELAFYWK